MKEKIEDIIKKLRALSAEIGKLPNPLTGPTHDPIEDNLDGASESIHDAIEELEDVVARL